MGTGGRAGSGDGAEGAKVRDEGKDRGALGGRCECGGLESGRGVNQSIFVDGGVGG